MGYEVIEAQRSGRIDLGLTRMENPRGEIERIRAVIEPFVVAIPKTHLLAEKVDLSISDLDGEPYISFTKDRGGYLKETLDSLFYILHMQYSARHPDWGQPDPCSNQSSKSWSGIRDCSEISAGHTDGKHGLSRYRSA